ncbi:MAG: helix-turn-helix domain-containing protein [Planctomycetes bacterium]|nr:helix-turn-helix domain-containing protein [Planctomycetota bacterium]
MNASEALKSLQLSICGGQRTQCGPEWAHGGDVDFLDPFGRLYYIKSGRGAVVHSGRVFELRRGKLFVIPAHVTGRYRCPRHMDLFWIHFEATVYSCLEPFALFGWEPVVQIAPTLGAEYLMQKAIDGVGREGTAEGVAAEGALRLLLSTFMKDSGAEEKSISEMARLIPVFDYINNHLGERLSLEKLAGVMHLQPNYFSNRFVAVTGMPPMLFINRRRIQEISSRLRFADETLGELAERYGFSDAFHLSKVFKRFTGLSPRQYRESAWREDGE